MGSGQWAVGSGQRAAGSGQRAVGRMQQRNSDGSMRYDRAAGETVQLPLATCLYLDVDTEVKRRCIEVNAEDAARLAEEAASLL